MKRIIYTSFYASLIIISLLFVSCKKKNDFPFEANPIAKAIKLETQTITKQQLDKIPEAYRVSVENGGTIEHITYKSKNYYGDGADNEKKANVYLPSGYDKADKSKKYKVLYLMHGIGGDENEWGMKDEKSLVKKMMDNLAEKGDIDPFIIVTPNGRSGFDPDPNKTYLAFYKFGEELRNDLIPYMDSHYNTYADRDHRAMAGLSMGGMQTINIGIGECIDLFGYFGAFSAAPTSNTAAVTASLLKDNTYPIYYFYNICGLQDSIAHSAHSSAVKALPALCDQFVEGENFMWQEVKGNHDFGVWYLGFYNFAQIVFK
jgi:endo-1,4-beta-xylanase